MTALVQLTRTEGLAHIVLARPEAGNAMSWDLIDQFAGACAEASADPTVRAVLITAQGKNFCVGGDIRSFAGEADPGAFIEKLATRLHEGIKALAASDAPLIVGVRGAAAGAGFSLAAAGDLVIAGAGASFTLAYSGIGLTSDGGATWSLPRLIGLRRTQELAFLNRRLTATEAEKWGLITRVVDDEAVEDEALALARQIAAGPTRAFGALKRLLGQSYAAPFAAQLDAEAQAIGTALRTRDAQGAVQAFLAREKPVFTGE